MTPGQARREAGRWRATAAAARARAERVWPSGWAPWVSQSWRREALIAAAEAERLARHWETEARRLDDEAASVASQATNDG